MLKDGLALLHQTKYSEIGQNMPGLCMYCEGHLLELLGDGIGQDMALEISSCLVEYHNVPLAVLYEIVTSFVIGIRVYITNINVILQLLLWNLPAIAAGSSAWGDPGDWAPTNPLPSHPPETSERESLNQQPPNSPVTLTKLPWNAISMPAIP